MTTVGELGAIYAALLLHEDKIPVTTEKITTVAKAANVEVNACWANLFSSLAKKQNFDDLMMNVGSGGGGAPVAVSAPAGGAAPAAAAAPAAEEKEDLKEESEEEDIGLGLFGNDDEY